MAQSLPVSPPRRTLMTLREFYDFEAAAEYKHEFVDGHVIDMSGGSENASSIEVNLARELSTRLRGTPCRAHGTNLKVRIPRTGRVRYPDAMVLCEATQFDPDDPRRHTVTNPRVLFEVLSPSTERTDRTIKFDDYRSIPSFQEYVLVSQNEPRVESLFRAADGAWRLSVQTEMAASVVVQSIGIELPMSEIYAGVTFDPPAVADA